MLNSTPFRHTMLTTLKARLRRWLHSGPTPDYHAGKNVVSIPNTLYVEALRQCLQRGETVQFPVRGWSMRIFVEHERDKAILKPCHPEKLRRGDVVLTRIDTADGSEVYVLHRIIRINGDRLTLRGDGNVGTTETCLRSDVVAFVSGFIRKGRTKPDLTSGLKWRIYSAIWVPLHPIRRYLLLTWKVLRRLHIING